MPRHRSVQHPTEPEQDNTVLQSSVTVSERASQQDISGRRLLRYGLGILWVSAGLLQTQPDMFTPDFYAWYPPKIMESVLQSVADGQPGWLASLIHAGSYLWGLHPVLFNIGAIITQLFAGSLLLFARSRGGVRFGLWLSVAWAAMVWIFAEGMGGLLTASTYFDGAPGAAFLYIVAALLLLLPERHWRSRRIHRGLQFALAGFWFWMDVLQALPTSGFWMAGTLFSQFANAAATPQPYVLSFPMQVFALLTNMHPVGWNLLFVTIMMILSLGTVLWLRQRWFLVFSLAWFGWSWWFAQDFGNLFSGIGTDVNSIPVLALLFLTSRADIPAQAGNSSLARIA